MVLPSFLNTILEEQYDRRGKGVKILIIVIFIVLAFIILLGTAYITSNINHLILTYQIEYGDKDDFTIFGTTPTEDLKNNHNITKNGSKQIYSYRIINNWDKEFIGYRINVDIYPDTYSIYSYDNQGFLRHDEKSDEKYFIVYFRERGKYDIRISAISDTNKELGAYEFEEYFSGD